ncbi:MAG: hypothetical protein K2J67_06390, partial [Lachnospiraceae bacterium]|nr:hypothetical protein [Lachnospiraceae bacterium]
AKLMGVILFNIVKKNKNREDLILKDRLVLLFSYVSYFYFAEYYEFHFHFEFSILQNIHY